MDINHSNRFHLAIEAGDLETTVPWYTNVLGCSLDMKEEGRWQDINFWGNELTLHASKPRAEKGNERSRHDVDMGRYAFRTLDTPRYRDLYPSERARGSDRRIFRRALHKICRHRL